jgi:hypothetical protein
MPEVYHDISHSDNAISISVELHLPGSLDCAIWSILPRVSGAVETFRQITWLIFKWISIACGGLIGLAIAVGMGVFEYTYDRHAQKVEFIISTERKDCDNDKWPIHLIIGNASGRTIEKVTFAFAARYPGRSSDLTRFNSYGDDHIIPSQEGWGACYAMPDLSEKVDDPRKLEWTIGYKTITFK